VDPTQQELRSEIEDQIGEEQLRQWLEKTRIEVKAEINSPATSACRKRSSSAAGDSAAALWPGLRWNGGRPAHLARSAAERRGGLRTGAGRGRPRGQQHPPSANDLRPGTAPEPRELSRILVHELFHFAWVRLSNDTRRSWGALVEVEMARRARGELGWSAEWRKQLLVATSGSRPPAVERVRVRELLRHGRLVVCGAGNTPSSRWRRAGARRGARGSRLSWRAPRACASEQRGRSGRLVHSGLEFKRRMQFRVMAVWLP